MFFPWGCLEFENSGASREGLQVSFGGVFLENLNPFWWDMDSFLTYRSCFQFFSRIPWVVPPHRMPVNTKSIIFLVGNPYKPSFVTVTGRGDNPRNTLPETNIFTPFSGMVGVDEFPFGAWPRGQNGCYPRPYQQTFVSHIPR